MRWITKLAEPSVILNDQETTKDCEICIRFQKCEEQDAVKSKEDVGAKSVKAETRKLHRKSIKVDQKQNLL